ncbi:YhjD/YihY/BrkB family envelope integrity protein [Kitasatospora sp. GP82]|uniref:YhjD/YihY/BrkB family envelope integrity protein n=1 Tax=Kitasatospora sp. GP82 TaxID=3035089 RepID=UPI0024767371|nr:YhjD/YihY/BrkB family envelope integrity protein [Kitasatospora sp. GP82]MDH6126404.1 membrane protein [Kitasatospora sp. GP82]
MSGPPSGPPEPEDRSRDGRGTGASALTGPLPAHGRLRALVHRMWRHGREVELMHRAMGFAALGFVTLVPLLIVVAAASPVHGAGFASWVVDGLGLAGRSAQEVRDLFSSPSQALSTTTALSLAVASLFGISFMAAVQTGYERVWRLPPAAWHTVWRQAIALAGLVGFLLAAAWAGVPWQASPAQPTLRLMTALGGGVLFFWWTQWLLLGGRVCWRALFPGSVATVLALVGLRIFSQLVFSPLIVSNALSYGTIGTVLVVQSWLVGVGFTVLAGALAGHAVWDRHRHHQHQDGPGARR